MMRLPEQIKVRSNPREALNKSLLNALLVKSG
jgi:hypothetical protein